MNSCSLPLFGGPESAASRDLSLKGFVTLCQAEDPNIWGQAVIFSKVLWLVCGRQIKRTAAFASSGR